MKKAEENPSLLFIVGLIIMVVMIGGFILAYANVFNTKDIEKNFDEFVEKLNGLSNGEEDSMLLYMEEGSAILGFSKDALKLRRVFVAFPLEKLKEKNIDATNDLYEAEESLIVSLDTGEIPDASYYINYFERPSLCKEGKACICLCSNFVYKAEERKCTCEGKMKCESLSSSKDLLKHINVYKLGHGYGKVDYINKAPNSQWYIVDGGFALERISGRFLNPSGGLGLTLAGENGYPAEVREVYFERKGNIIGVCLDKPCIFEKPSEVTGTEDGAGEEEKSESENEGLLPS